MPVDPKLISSIPLDDMGQRLNRPQEGESVGSGDCTGLTFDFILTPTPSELLLVERSDRGLAARIDVHMLDNDLLLAAATNAGEGFHLDREGAQELRRHVPIRLEALERVGVAGPE